MSLTTAYAGHADTKEENIPAVLDTFLPGQLGLVIIPERVPRSQAGLKKVVTWLESEVGKNGTIPEPDLIAALLARKDYEEDGEAKSDDLALVMLYDPENEDDVALAKAATEAGIKVVDLTAAGDDLLLDDAVVSFEETPVEPEPEAPAPEAAADIEAAPWEDKTAPADIKETIDRAAAAGVEAAEAVKAARAAQPATGVNFHFTLQVPLEGIQVLADAVVRAMGNQAAQALVAAVEDAPDPTAGTSGAQVSHIKAAGDGEKPPEGTSPYYYDREKGTYRRARGMARQSEDKVHLDAREVRELKESKLLA